MPEVPVNFYVDGFNLYHALLRFRDPKVEWLDLAKLCHRLILPKTERIQAIKYFSAYAHWLPDSMARHQEYIKALEATGVIAIMGHFKNKDRECKACKARWIAHEEKETDVSIGITMLNDAYKGQYERAYLVTRDSDLMPAVKLVRTEFPKKQIVAVAPPSHGSLQRPPNPVPNQKENHAQAGVGLSTPTRGEKVGWHHSRHSSGQIRLIKILVSLLECQLSSQKDGFWPRKSFNLH